VFYRISFPFVAGVPEERLISRPQLYFEVFRKQNARHMNRLLVILGRRRSKSSASKVFVFRVTKDRAQNTPYAVSEHIWIDSIDFMLIREKGRREVGSTYISSHKRRTVTIAFQSAIFASV